MNSDILRVMITGASGFIGRACVENLAKTLPVEVHAISYTKAPISDLPTAENIIWHRLDLLNPDLTEIGQLIQLVQPSALLHLAWYLNPLDYKNSIENIRWLDSSTRLFELFYALGGGVIIGVGSCFEYISKSGLFKDAGAEPANLYAEAKYNTAMMGLHLAEMYNRKFSWVRIFYVYGPHEYSQRIIPKMIDSFLLKTPLKVQSSGNHLLDYLYVDDVANGLALATFHAMYGTTFPYLDLGSSRPVSLKTIVKSLEEYFQVSSKDLISFSSERSDGPLVVMSNYPSYPQLGWSPKVDWVDGLEKAISYRREVLGL